MSSTTLAKKAKKLNISRKSGVRRIVNVSRSRKWENQLRVSQELASKTVLLRTFDRLVFRKTRTLWLFLETDPVILGSKFGKKYTFKFDYFVLWLRYFLRTTGRRWQDRGFGHSVPGRRLIAATKTTNSTICTLTPTTVCWRAAEWSQSTWSELQQHNALSLTIQLHCLLRLILTFLTTGDGVDVTSKLLIIYSSLLTQGLDAWLSLCFIPS